jgi:U-box domain
MTILVNNVGEDCNRGISKPIGKDGAVATVTRTETSGDGNLELDEENANIPPTTTISSDAKRCTFQQSIMMVDTTATMATTDNSSGDNHPKEGLSPTPKQGTLVAGSRRSDAESIPFSILQDPLTNVRMVDPVVNPAGDSYERSSLLLTDESIEFYPNRALQAILKHQDDYEKRQHTTSDSNLSKELSAASAKANDWWFHDLTKNPPPPLPEAFYCPITCDIMVDPWIGPDGSTYEYDGIKAWLAQSDRDAFSPVTRQKMSLGQLRPNHALYELIQWETQRPPSERHAAVQRWVESTPNTKRTPRPNHPLPPSATSLLPGTSSTQPSAQNTASRQAPPTQVAGQTTASTTVSEEQSDMHCWTVVSFVGTFLVVLFVFIH